MTDVSYCPNSQGGELADPGPLSAREAERVYLLNIGQTDKEAARVMGISPRTAKAHIEHAMQKLGAVNRTHLVSLAYCRGILKAAGHITFAMLCTNILAGTALFFALSGFDDNDMMKRRHRRATQQLRLYIGKSNG